MARSQGIKKERLIYPENPDFEKDKHMTNQANNKDPALTAS